MMKNRRWLLILMMVALSLGGAFGEKTPALALEAADVETAAARLSELGLLLGDGEDLGLEQPCNRLHGAALFTRLLGREEEALTNRRHYPFLDIAPDSWAAPYVGYLYNQGLAYGEAADHYGAGELHPAHFATFCLRALGYYEGKAEFSDFLWSDALDVMVEKHIISGALRNRLHDAVVFTRGDAALLAEATLSAQLKQGELTLWQQLAQEGLLDAPPPGQNFRIAYPTGLLDDEILARLGQELGLELGLFPYEPGLENEEQLYRELREPKAGYDLCIIPGHLLESLREDNMLKKFTLREFGSREDFLAPLRDNPYWRDEKSGDYYGLPLAFTQPCLYYNSSLVQNPDWGWLFREAYSGGVYMPADPLLLAPLALHYFGLPYEKVEEYRLAQAVSLLSGQIPAVKGYFGPQMTEIAEGEGAVFGVISSRQLPELVLKQEQDPAYQTWRAELPSSGAPLTVYYGVMMAESSSKQAAPLLRALLDPEIAAANAMNGGYLPGIQGAVAYYSESFKKIYGLGPGERSRLLPGDRAANGLYQQIVREAFLEQAADSQPPAVSKLEFSFYRAGGGVYRAYLIDLEAKTAAAFWAGENDGQEEITYQSSRSLPATRVKDFQSEAARLGLIQWKEYYDGPTDGPGWSLTLDFEQGESKTLAGFGLPLLWPELAAALLTLCGEEAIPPAL